MLLVADINTDLSQICLEVHKYKFDLDAILPPRAKYVSSRESTPPIDTWAYTTFMNIANKTKMTYKKTLNEEENAIFEA